MEKERSAAAVSLPAAGPGDRGERCRNESRSRIVVVVHPIMRLARHFRSRAANNPFSTWEALIIVWRDERNNRRRRGKRQGYREQIRGRGRRGIALWAGERRSMMFYFFRKLIEIARDHLPIDLFRGRTNQINQREWSRNEFRIIILSGLWIAPLLDGSVHHESLRPQIESRNRFQAAVDGPSRALKYIYAIIHLGSQRRYLINNTPYMCITLLRY